MGRSATNSALADDNLSTRIEARNNGEENHNGHETENTQSTGGEARHARGTAFLPYDHTTTNVHNLIARLHFLEADCRYHAALCPLGEKSAVFSVRHRGERDEIMQRLPKTVPDRFDDAMELFDFATKRLKIFDTISRIGSETVIIDMLKNARTAIFKANARMRADYVLRLFDEGHHVAEDAA